jgi:hypothetical protein
VLRDKLREAAAQGQIDQATFVTLRHKLETGDFTVRIISTAQATVTQRTLTRIQQAFATHASGVRRVLAPGAPFVIQ